MRRKALGAEDPCALPSGYLLPEGMTMRDVRQVDAEFLASEGIELLADEETED